jgi:hypothetical protein
MSASAISAMTRVLRAPFFMPPAPVRPPSLSASCKSTFDAWSAGARPKSTPVRSETPTVKPSTQRSTPTS